MRSIVSIAAGLVLSCVAVACGSSNDKGFNGDGGTSSSGGGSSSGGSSSGGGSGSSSGPVMGPGGVVTVQQSINTTCGGITYVGTVSAAFSQNEETLLANPSCAAATTSGECSVQLCDANSGTPPAPVGDEGAGTIGVTGVSPAVMLPPNGDGSYSPFDTTSTGGPFIPPAGMLTVTASGGMVPSFKTTLTFGGANVTSPVLVNDAVQFPASGDVPVAWGGTDDLQIFLQATSASDQTKDVEVDCVFSGGSGSIPASVMSMMGSFGSIGIGPIATTNVTAGSYAVTIKAQAINSVGIFSKQ